MNLDDLIGFLCLAFVVGFFSTICTILRFAMGVTWSFDVDSGPRLRRSWWGNAGVNSVSCRGMVQVVEYQNGWLVRVLPTFVFGVLWMPRAATDVGPLQPGGWFIPAWRVLECGSDTVVLNGHLAKFISEPRLVTMEPTVPSAKS